MSLTRLTRFLPNNYRAVFFLRPLFTARLKRSVDTATPIFFITTLLPWILLAAASVWQYKSVFAQQCFFHTSWLLCSVWPITLAKVFFFLFIVIVFGLATVSGYQVFTVCMSSKSAVYLRRLRWVLIAVLFSCVLTLPFGSSDITYYFSSGKVVSEAMNPYVQEWLIEKPFMYPGEPQPTIWFSYGPVFLHGAQALYQVVSAQVISFILVWKLLMAGSLLLCASLVWRLIRHHDKSIKKDQIYVLLGLQPLLLFEWVVNGHFDGVWLICLLLAVLWAYTNRWWAVFPVLVLGIWIKFIPLLMLPWFLLWWYNNLSQQNWKSHLGQLCVGGFMSAFLTYVVWQPYWVGFAVFRTLVIQSKWAVMSLFNAIYQTLSPLFLWLLQEQAHWYLTRLVQGSLVLFIVYLLFPYIKQVVGIVLRRQQWQPIDFVQAIFVTMVIYLFVWQKSLWPWYGAWMIPLGVVLWFVHRNRFVRQIVIWMSISPLLFYIVWQAHWLLTRTDATPELWFNYVVVLSVVLYPLWQIWRWRKVGYRNSSI